MLIKPSLQEPILSHLLYASNIYNMLRVRNRWISVWTLLISKQISFNADLISKVQGTQFATPKFGTDWGLHSTNQWRCRVSVRLLYQTTSAARNTFCIPLPYQQVALPHPLTQKDGCSELPSLDSDESLHSSVRTVFKSQCTLWNVAASPLTHYISEDSAFTTAVSTGKCINTRHALYCKFTWAIKYKL